MKRTLMTHANVIDGLGGRRQNATIVIEGDRIAAVIQERDEIGTNDTVIDLKGKTVMPGMCIGHFHAEYDRITTMPWFNQGSEAPPGLAMAYAIKNMKIALHAGFTSAVGSACAYDIDVCLDMAMAEGVCEGPRILPASPHIIATGAHAYAAPWWIGVRNMGLEQGQCTGPDEFRRYIRMQAHRGVRMMKIMPSGGHGFPDTSGMRNLSKEELQACVDAAHERGALIRAHVNYKDQILECVRAGVDLIDHADHLDDECIDAMVKHGTYYCPTIGLTMMAIRWDKTRPLLTLLTYYPKDEAYITTMAHILQRAQKAGVKMLIGDDYGPVHGFLPDFWGSEMNMFIDELNFDPEALIEIVTSNGARFFNGETGAIAPGRLADLLVLDFDPLRDGFKGFTDPEANILAVMKGGVFVKNGLSVEQVRAAA